jgi:hypothetical protein
MLVNLRHINQIRFNKVMSTTSYWLTFICFAFLVQLYIDCTCYSMNVLPIQLTGSSFHSDLTWPLICPSPVQVKFNFTHSSQSIARLKSWLDWNYNHPTLAFAHCCHCPPHQTNLSCSHHCYHFVKVCGIAIVTISTRTARITRESSSWTNASGSSATERHRTTTAATNTYFHSTRAPAATTATLLMAGGSGLACSPHTTASFWHTTAIEKWAAWPRPAATTLDDKQP